MWVLQNSLRAVYLRSEWLPNPSQSALLYCNHHYWWDGCLCYLLARHWRVTPLGWMEDLPRFPPFRLLGALPFPLDNLWVRVQTIRRTVVLLRQEPRLFFLFPEGVLHPDEERLLPFQRSLHWLAIHLPQMPVLPFAITLRISYHQYPCAYLWVGEPLPTEWLSTLAAEEWLRAAQQRLQDCLQRQRNLIRSLRTDEEAHQHGYEVLLQGKKSLHERWLVFR